MDLSKLTYSKEDSKRTPAEVPSHELTTESKEDGGTSVVVKKVPPVYRKEEGVLSTSLVFVMSGGEKREKDFLRELIRQLELHSLRVAFMSEKGQGLQPYQMQERWNEIKSTGFFKIDSQVYNLDTTDKVFLLSDVDEFYDQLEKIFKDSPDDEQGQWIVSNPCFEIWLYYCYLNDPEKDLECLKSESVVIRSKKLKTMGNSLVSGGLNPNSAFERMVAGIEHSAAHYGVDENGIPVLFATQMHMMAQYLIDAMNKNANEYSEYVRRKGVWRVLMRKQSFLKNKD